MSSAMVLNAPPTPALRWAARSDLDALRRFLAGLSLQSAYRRFFAGVRRVSDPMLVRLLSQDASRTAVVAVHDGEIVGHAMYALSHGDEPTADIAVVVADAWQRRGIGSRLVAAVVDEARARGVRRAGFTVLPENEPVRRMVLRTWPDSQPRYVDGELTYLVDLRPTRLPRPRLPRRARPAAITI